MEYRSLGRTGVQVSPLCLGTMSFGNPTTGDEAIRIVDAALDAGINLVDTANTYNAGESEAIVGRALSRDGKRQRVVLATKVYGNTGKGPNDGGPTRYHILRAVDDSLRRLQTDYIDLYQLHRPSFSVPHDETLRALDDLVRQGKVRYIGCSNFPAWKLMEGLAVSEREGLARYICAQPPYNLLDRRIENELVPLCQAYGVGIIPWSPIAAGILAGRYPVGGELPEDSRGARHAVTARRINDAARGAGQRMVELASERGLTAAQLALLWAKEQPGITAPITGPRTLEQLQEALTVLDRRLDDSDRPLFDAINPPGSALVHFHDVGGWMKQGASNE
jgi:aryl-alcohol dehydrogenase-like predicted oxidoreductase